MSHLITRSFSTESWQPKRTGSSVGAYLNIICQSGWIGLLLIGIGSFVGTLSSVLLRNFNQIGYAAFGTPGRTVIYIFLLIYVVGVVGDYIILSGQNFHQLTRDSGHDIGEAAWKVICATIILKQMSEAFLLSIITILIAVTLSFISNGAVPVEHRPAVHRVADGPGVAIAMATITFAFCGVSVMPSIESSMRRPKQWNAVLVTGTYLLVGIVGYWAFGDQNAATKAAKVLISLHVILAAPIIAASFAFELENALGITCEQLGRVKELVYRVLFRTMFFAAMTGVALGIPVMALVGAFSTSLMVCVIPILKGWDIAAVIALGVYTCVFGAKGAIEDLRADIGHGK
ncbi:transmembrane amino acid transporter protein-domain-containing protein [Kickxella alabastrina]|uniref:transmembrane amino acid transporter protein-domain-containing protein n=1 Tax=Kickxella alabastrina TaxID=61397 RepID=UPI0022201121|nr:transmembrane amino acid transporter protein-domain-containing protein [Kickxella alabastrina]KAI7830074.1 transmembrane amino acid transporter protein-domain-containing protein [Kickxella alabastrina]